ncbi:hypothetical protein, partial [Stenotrophomonas maltophilia]|uniref:hypothetical protein n=1 Tax=Stenotrophomonas maltophilia TaxID=40324 RepID=UPI003BA1D92A
KHARAHLQRLPASGRHYRARLLEGPKSLQQHSCYMDVLAAGPGMASPSRLARKNMVAALSFEL